MGSEAHRINACQELCSDPVREKQLGRKFRKEKGVPCITVTPSIYSAQKDFD